MEFLTPTSGGSDSPEGTLTFVNSLVRFGVDDRPLRRGRLAAEQLRIRRGAYAKDADWQQAKSLERYRMRILSVVATRRKPPIVSHMSAAAMYGYPVVGGWPWHVDLLVGERSGVRTKNGVIVHRDAVREEELVDCADARMTSPARTLADLARVLSFEDAVVMLDRALNPELAPGLTHVSKGEILACLDAGPNGRGRRAAKRAIDFANGLSGSVGETRSRVAIYELGFPTPLLQVRHPSLRVSHYDTDFEWLDYRRIGEFDGGGKYLKEELRDGNDAAQIVYEEKLREDELRSEGNGVIRWGWAELGDRSRLRGLLLNAGLPIVGRPLPPGQWR